MKFSERIGHQPVRTQLQIESIDDELKNSLWTAYLETFLKKLSNSRTAGFKLGRYVRSLWFQFFKLPMDNAPIDDSDFVQWADLVSRLRNFFLNNISWYAPYDLLEFSVDFADSKFVPFLNEILEREKSGYRFVHGQLIQITSKVEIDEIEQAIDATLNLDAVNAHLRAALKELADKENPVYRNSVKESISAVESICKMYTGNEKTTLGDALTKLEKDGAIHPALKKTFSALYGYTSDSGGIRHALTENDRQVDFFEAKFILVTCTAFINYLLSKMA